MSMNKEQRLHPLYILFILFDFVKALWPIAVIVVLQRPDVASIPWWWYACIAGGTVVLLGYGWIRWKRFEYVLEADKFVIRKGVLFREEKAIYYKRIHSVNTEQPFFQRLLGVMQLKIETPGGKTEGDGVLPAVTIAEATRLQQLLRERSEGMAAAGGSAVAEHTEVEAHPAGELASDASSNRVTTASHADSGNASHAQAGNDAHAQSRHAGHTQAHDQRQAPLVQLTLRNLLLAAVSTVNIGLVITFALGVISFADDILPAHIYKGIIDQLNTFLPGWWSKVAIGLLVAWLLSAVLFVIKHGGFTVRYEGQQISIAYGLLDKKKHLFAPERVHAVVVKEGVVRKWLGYASVELQVETSTKQERLMLHPLVKLHEVAELMKLTVPQFTMDTVQNRPPTRAWAFYIRYDLLFAIAVCCGLIWYFGSNALWSLVLVPLHILYAHICYRDAGTALTDRQLTLRNRHLARNTHYIRRKHVVALNIKGTPLQRKLRLFTINVHLLGGSSGTSWTVPYMEQHDVEAIWKWYSRRSSK
ncbi:PH domain-containing protein [Paenibacillus sp. 481]|uniref:PH domain-containing protein n=1 Tax=Paenibacillus sp. 481 TaxID=2835869 RepID=UPI001E2B8F1E|nr:PH domain-containing protein [Paenibacillus sp. 481]UHA73785.1 PH domain-containing protein [Paenibacillus sp. 481]